MKIAFFVTRFPSLSETFIANQIIALQNSGNIVHIFSHEKPVDGKVHEMVSEAELQKNTFYLSTIPRSRTGKIITLLSKLVNYLTTRKIQEVYRFAFKNKNQYSVYELIHYLDKPNYDVLHAHFGPNGNYVAGLRTAGLFKEAKFVTTFHGYDMMVDPTVYRKLLSSDVTVTVNSEYSKNQILKLGCPIDKINILPVGLNTAYFIKNKKQEQIFTLLFVGRLVAFKGPDIFIKICKELADRNQIDFKAVMIGDGELKQQLKKQIQVSGLDSVVELAGSKTQEEIKANMENADVFVLPGITDNGRAETQGLVIQEAQAMQLPVFVSDAGGMKEGMKDGVTGFVIKEGDVNTFADKIVLLAQDYELRERMGKEGSRFVEENYESVLLTEKLMRLYNKSEV